MIKKRPILLCGLVFTLFLLFGYSKGVEAATINKTLTENTKIMPHGVIMKPWAAIPEFKKGTVVTLNEYGEVIEGILAEDVSLPYGSGISGESMKQTGFTPMPFYIFSNNTYTVSASRVLSFKGGTKIIFNDKGEVVRGTLNSSNQSIVIDQITSIQVAEGEVSFHQNGMIASYTLLGDSYLRPSGWSQILTENNTEKSLLAGFIEFKGGTPIVLNENGQVIKGTLSKDTKLLSPASLLSDSGIKVFSAGTTVEFDDKGFVLRTPRETNAI